MNNDDFIALLEQYQQEELASVHRTSFLMNQFYKEFAPRAYANSFVKSEEGKTLKASLYKQQKGHCCNLQCPSLGAAMAIELLQMDHRIPLALMKHRANKLENFALLCSFCNARKGTKIVDFAKGW